MDFGGFFLFIALAVSGLVLMLLTIFVRSHRKKFANLLALNIIALLVLGGWLYKVYWIDMNHSRVLQQKAIYNEFNRCSIEAQTQIQMVSMV